MTDTPTFDALARKAAGATPRSDALWRAVPAQKDAATEKVDTPTYDALARRDAADHSTVDGLRHGKHRKAGTPGTEPPRASRGDAVQVVRDVASVLGVSPAAVGPGSW